MSTLVIRARRWGWAQDVNPAVPAAPVMTDQVGVSVTLDWADSLNVAFYEVWRSATVGGVYVKLASPTASTYVHTGAPVGANYYRIYVIDKQGHISAPRAASQVHA